MPEKYQISIAEAPHRFDPIGRFTIKREEGCINCGKCAFEACLYSVHERSIRDPRKMADPITYLCKGCFRCVQVCPRNALTICYNPAYASLGDAYWNPDIIRTSWDQAETGKIPVTGAGYRGPFSGDGFDSIWTDMSEIVRPTRDGIHGREYISTVVDIGRKLQKIEFDTRGKVLSDIPPRIEIPLPVIFDILPFAGFKNIQGAIAQASGNLGNFMITKPDEWFDPCFKENLIPLIDGYKDFIKGCRMVELEYSNDITEHIAEIKSESPDTIVGIRIPFKSGVEDLAGDLAQKGVEVIHLEADINGRGVDSEKPAFIKDMLRDVHLHLVDLKIRDEITIIVSGGIGLPEHLAKAIICGADLVAINIPLLLALECRYCGRCLSGYRDCPVDIAKIDPVWGSQRIVNLIGSWHSQLLEVLGAMGLREVRRLRGEVGRAIFKEEIDSEIFGKVFGGEV